MKLFKFFLRYASLCLLISCGHEAMAAPAPEKIQLTEEDIATLEAMGFSRAEALETANLINNMSPDEQNALAQIGQQVAQDMVKAGLDPNDPEQMMNFMPKAGAKPRPEPTPIQKQERPFIPSQEAPTEMKATPQPTKNPMATGNIEIMLKEILKHLASLRQKRQTSEKLHRFGAELDALAFNLDFINRPELFPYITSQEFSHLYMLLEQLHRALLTYEPRITAFPFFEEDEIENPYETLELPINARPKEIDQAYRKLKQKNDPDILAKTERIKKLSKKEKERILTEAKLAFIEIKAAYESLKNPKEKAAIDRALAEYQSLEEKNEQLSDNAYDSLIEMIENILVRQRLLKDIDALLKKYAPEEKKKLDEWEKQRLSALDMSKKEYENALARGRTQRVITPAMKEDIGEKFWREFRIPESTGRGGGYPSFTSSSFEPSRPTGGTPFGPEPEMGKKLSSPEAPKGKDKEAGKESGGAKESSEKGSKEDKPKEGPRAQSEGPKKEEKINETELDEAKELMHKADFKEIKKAVDNAETERLIGLDLPTYLSKAPVKPKEEEELPVDASLKKIDDLMKKTNLIKIEKDFSELHKIASGIKKTDQKNALGKAWQEFSSKYIPTINKLQVLISHNLDPLFAPSYSKSGVQQNFEAQRFELLNLTDPEQAKRLKEIKATNADIQPGQEGFLGNFKESVNRIHELAGKISKALGVSPAGKK